MNRSAQLVLELPSTLGHILTKRGRVLRDGGSKGLSTLLSGNNSTWISTEVSARLEAKVWDLAHEVSSRLKKEFGSAVYVEPAASGRFHNMISPESEPEPSQISYPSAPSSGVHGSAISINRPNLGVRSGNNYVGPGGAMGMPSARGAHMAHGGVPAFGMGVPSMSPADQYDLTSRHLRESAVSTARARDLSCPALRSAKSFKDLPAAAQMMFEVEAAQIMRSIAQSPLEPAMDDHSQLMLLAFQPGVSKTLKAFLEKAIGLKSLK